MANTQGIIFSDLFITNKEMFVDFFEKYYLENKLQLDVIITKLNNVLTEYQTKSVTAAMASAFQASWGEFQKYVLLNTQDLQLIVAYRGYRGKDAVFSQIVKQSDVEGVVNGVYGINTGNELIKDSMESLRAQQVEKFLQLHLNGFLNQLEQKIDKDEAKILHRYHQHLLHSDFQQKGAHITGQPWRAPFYGRSGAHFFSGRGLGQAYDAFMNHLGNHNRQVYDYLLNNGLTQNSTVLNTIEKASVFNEEGGASRFSNFPRLLNESKNHVGWYTGGDIIIVNPKTMGIVYNIQLKTTTENRQSVFVEKVSAIRTFIEQFIQYTPRQKGEKLFDFLLTSVSNKNDFNTMPQQTIDDIIYNELLKKIKTQF